jgi:L-ascorbate metabolism protein UlaG (beta-lactamase superfamily)
MLRLPDESGVIRLQHASLLFQSSSAKVIVDPHLHSEYSGTIRTFSVADLEVENIGAVLITHAHRDHFSLSTLMLFPRSTPIIVPHVPRVSIIGDDMAGLLRSVGFTNVLEPKWYDEPVVVKDLRIHALPFYGEQPLRYECVRYPDLRNWGNTYVVETSEYVAWLLVDSGNDPMGTMAEVAERVRSKFGRVDLLLSNLNVFSAAGNPYYITGEGHYWLCLTESQMSRFVTLSESGITLGPAGVAEIARIVNARAFLPYAHWWSDLGTEPNRDAEQVAVLAEVADQLRARNEIWRWNIGDGYFGDRCQGFRRHSCLI